MTHYSCGNTSSIAEVDLRTLARPVTEEDPRPVVSAPLHHVPRQFQNCAGGASDQQCECATLCGPLPFCNLGPAPAQSDCNVISDALSTVAGSFLVPSGQATGFSFGSCEAVFANEASTTLEYCFENMASLTAATFTNCVTIAHGGVGGCIADDFRWFFELHITGTPIQIP
ncbi:hypothetical protein BXZ70DRAFT_653767 [Cristinia sonorae]|uniref:Uncharacterized protein n=1 Tax=Cristinia sonorae TaxID=1940300 RepID=A0A8K0XK49_9AGAR|nr:hypothetical protein BXZ70DRAFT_653767 [Cristinia sonorae]